MPARSAASIGAELGGGGAVGEHRALPVDVHEHDHAAGAPATLQAHVDAGAARSLPRRRGRAASSPTRPMKRTSPRRRPRRRRPRWRRCRRATGVTAAGLSVPARGRPGRPHDDVLDEVAHDRHAAGALDRRAAGPRRGDSDAAGRADRVDHQPDARLRQVHRVVRQTLDWFDTAAQSARTTSGWRSAGAAAAR